MECIPSSQKPEWNGMHSRFRARNGNGNAFRILEECLKPCVCIWWKKGSGVLDVRRELSSFFYLPWKNAFRGVGLATFFEACSKGLPPSFILHAARSCSFSRLTEVMLP